MNAACWALHGVLAYHVFIDMRISITVKPGSKKGPLVQQGLLGDLLVYVREPALDGKANKAVVELLAKHYAVSKSSVTILRGQTSVHKLVEVVGIK